MLDICSRPLSIEIVLQIFLREQHIGWTRILALARLVLTQLWNPLDYIENPNIYE